MSDVPAVSALECPRCGSSPDPEGGSGLLARCRSCGILGRIEDPRGAPALVALPAITLAEAVARSGRPADSPAEFLFVPFWRFETVLLARVRGTRDVRTRVVERQVDEEGRAVFASRWTEGGDEEVEKEVQRLLVATVSACPLEELGLPTLDRNRQLGPLRVGRRLDQLGDVRVFHPALRALGTFLDPLVPRDRARLEADALRSAAVEGLAAGLREGASVEPLLPHETVVLLHYPLVLVGREAGAGPGAALVDGLGGEVVGERPTLSTHEKAHGHTVLTLAGGLGLGWLCGSLLHAALFPPRILATPDTVGLRLKLALGAAAALVLGGGALRRWARGATEPS